jgi:uncharacterized protein YbjT (DUF2867 family)
MFVVAGVTGHVGSVVAAELLSRGEKVKVIVREASKGAVWAKKGAGVAVALASASPKARSSRRRGASNEAGRELGVTSNMLEQ